MYAGDGNRGGGEILRYLGEKPRDDWYMLQNQEYMKQLQMIPMVKVIIFLLIAFLGVLIIMQVFQVKSAFKGKAMTHELKYLDNVRKKEQSVLQANQLMSSITKIIEHTPLALGKSYVDYWNYNLTRANIRIPGGSRVMKAQEFNAIIKFVEIVLVAISLILIIFVTPAAGTMLLVMTVFLANQLPMMFVRTQVTVKDGEIVENFADMYLMLHYILLASSGTPIEGVLKSFDKTTTSTEMHRFVDCCVHYIDTYGEYQATRYISREYREIPLVTKLMRLIRQANEGGDIRAELNGFRNELLEAKRYEIEKRMNKLVSKAQKSFTVVLGPILIQAIISAMAIYAADLGLASTFMNF